MPITTVVRVRFFSWFVNDLGIVQFFETYSPPKAKQTDPNVKRDRRVSVVAHML